MIPRGFCGEEQKKESTKNISPPPSQTDSVRKNGQTDFRFRLRTPKIPGSGNRKKKKTHFVSSSRDFSLFAFPPPLEEERLDVDIKHGLDLGCWLLRRGRKEEGR